MNWLTTDFGLDLVEASDVLGQCVRFDIANVYNPAYSVACRLSRNAIPNVHQKPLFKNVGLSI